MAQYVQRRLDRGRMVSVQDQTERKVKMDKRKDALAVNNALQMKNEGYDLLAKITLEPIFIGIINRYDQKPKSAKLTVIASEALECLNRNTFIFRVKDVKEMCEYLLK